MSSFESRKAIQAKYNHIEDNIMQDQIDSHKAHLVEQYFSAKCAYYQSVLKEAIKQQSDLNLGALTTLTDMYFISINKIDRLVTLEVCFDSDDTEEIIIKVFVEDVVDEFEWIAVKMDDVIFGHWQRFNKAIADMVSYNRGIQGALCC